MTGYDRLKTFRLRKRAETALQLTRETGFQVYSNDDARMVLVDDNGIATVWSYDQNATDDAAQRLGT